MFLSSVEYMLESQSPFKPIPQQKPAEMVQKPHNVPKQIVNKKTVLKHSPGVINPQQLYLKNAGISPQNTQNNTVLMGAGQKEISQPYAISNEIDDSIHKSNFVKPNLHNPPTPGQQPPRPLSSSSYNMSAQPSPANSNYSGDPPTPMHPGTPQSNRSLTPHNNQQMQSMPEQIISQVNLFSYFSYPPYKLFFCRLFIF